VEKREASQLADGVLRCVTADDPTMYALRPMLSDSFKMLQAPERFLIVARPELKVYLLNGLELLIQAVGSESLTLSLRRVDLSQAPISRSSHDAEVKSGVVSWSSTWRLKTGPDSREEFTGQMGLNGPDEVEQFARAVATAAGWPLEPLVDPSGD